MTTLGPDDVRARRRPGVILAVTASRLLCGFCLAYPLAALLGTSNVGLRAEGDRLLFEGGGYLLLEVARLQGPALSETLRGLLPMLTVAWLVTALGNAVLFTALSQRDEREAPSLLARALVRLPTLLLISLLTTLAQAALLVLASIAAEAVPDPLARPQASSFGQAAIWLLALIVAGALGGVGDVARASSVRAQVGLPSALERCRRCLVHRPLTACFGWIPYAALFALSVASVAQLTDWLDVSRPGAWRIALVFLAHQLVVLISVTLRATWYARALRLTATSP